LKVISQWLIFAIQQQRYAQMFSAWGAACGPPQLVSSKEPMPKIARKRFLDS